MRAPLPLFAAAVFAGAWFGDAFPALATEALALALAACAAAPLALHRPRAAALAACAAAFAAGAGVVGERVARCAATLGEAPRDAVVEGRVVSAEPAGSRTRVMLRDVAWFAPAAEGPGQVDVWIEAPAAPPNGSTIRAAIRTRSVPLGAANPGGPDPGRSLARRGIGASARARDALLLQIVELPPSNPSTWLENRRRRAIERLRAHERGGALLAALALGHAGALPERDRSAWAALGIAHLLSVSGLHLALAAGAAFALARRGLARPALAARSDTRRLALLAALVAAAAYAALAGLATPALRSLAMLAALAAAFALRRPASARHALAGAALLALLVEPSDAFSPGAQLSFAATAALVIARASGAERRAGRLGRALAALLSSSALATLATAPIAALHFGAAPPLAGVANLVAIPLTAALAMPLAFAASACALVAPGGLADAWIARAASVAAFGLDGLLALADLAPRVAPHPPSASALALAAVACGLGVRTTRLGVRVACAFAAQLALAALPPPAVAPPIPRFVFLDVGHGDAALVQAPGFALLVDAGPAERNGWDAGARVAVPALAALGVRRLGALAVTHADLDHRGGAAAVLRAFPCEALWLPRGALRDRAFAGLVAAARERGVRVEERGLGDAPLLRSGLRVEFLWPPPRADERGENDRSLVLRVDLAGVRALLPGDLEASGEAALLEAEARVGADVLKLAHHGSRSSTTSELLGAVRPRLAIASAPRHGRFGWPHSAVRQRVVASGAGLAWTGRDGAVVVHAGEQACVRRWRGPESCRPLHSLVGARAPRR